MKSKKIGLDGEQDYLLKQFMLHINEQPFLGSEVSFIASLLYNTTTSQGTKRIPCSKSVPELQKVTLFMPYVKGK